MNTWTPDPNWTPSERKRAYNKWWKKTPAGRACKRRWKRRYRKKPREKIIRRARERLREIVKNKRYSLKTVELIGCTPDFLCAWIEKQWGPGMSWENYGQWHIDHILPCADFNLADPEHAKLCFHYTNLRPLWAKENIDKSDYVAPGTQPELPMGPFGNFS